MAGRHAGQAHRPHGVAVVGVEDHPRIVGRGRLLDRGVSDQIAEFLRQPVFALGVVIAEHPGAGGGQGQLQPPGAGVGLVAGQRQVGDVLAEAIHLVAPGLQPASAAVKDPRVPPVALGGQVAHFRLGRAFFAGQPLADGVVDLPVILMLDEA